MIINEDTIIKEIKRISNELGAEKLTRSEFSAKSGISSWKIYQIFRGGWREAIEKSGLIPDHRSILLDNNQLFNEMLRVFRLCGEICSTMIYSKESQYSLKTYTKRFGKWDDVLLNFKIWLEENKIEFEYFDKLPSNNLIAPVLTGIINNDTNSSYRKWDKITDNIYGSFLNFRGLQHAPVNEQGVVFLFGMICFELGFIVEAIRTAYPDCDAKRCIDNKREKWERVRIEFEFKSSNFKDHGHKHDLCDVIVCWVDDWEDCPLEVIELKSEIIKLDE